MHSQIYVYLVLHAFIKTSLVVRFELAMLNYPSDCVWSLAPLLVGVLQNKPAFSQAHQQHFQTSALLTQRGQRKCNGRALLLLEIRLM